MSRAALLWEPRGLIALPGSPGQRSSAGRNDFRSRHPSQAHDKDALRRIDAYTAIDTDGARR